MPVSSQDFNSHHDRVVEEFDDEIAHRCAISRGYYYAFHLIRSNYDSHPQSYFKHGPGDHSRVRDFLSEVGENHLSKLMEDLCDVRNKADYDINMPEVALESYYKAFENDLEEFINGVNSSSNLP